MTNVSRVSFWGDEIVLELNCSGIGVQLGEYIKATELYTVKGESYGMWIISQGGVEGGEKSGTRRSTTLKDCAGERVPLGD